MSSVILSEMRQRRGTSAQWAASDRVLAAGECGVDVTVGRVKVGDGVTGWSALPWLTVAEADAESLIDGLDAHVSADPIAHQADAIGYDGPADGSTVAEALDALAGGKRDADAPFSLRETLAPAGHLRLHDDFVAGTSTPPGWGVTTTGAGAAVGMSVTSLTGVVTFATGTTAGGAALIQRGPVPFTGSVRWRLKWGTPPDETDAYRAWVGIGIPGVNDCIVALIDETSEWVQLRCTVGGNTTVVDSTVPRPVGPTIDDNPWMTLELLAFGSSALLRIDGDIVASVGTNVPPGGSLSAGIVKTAGTLTRPMRVDFVDVDVLTDRSDA